MFCILLHYVTYLVCGWITNIIPVVYRPTIKSIPKRGRWKVSTEYFFGFFKSFGRFSIRLSIETQFLFVVIMNAKRIYNPTQIIRQKLNTSYELNMLNFLYRTNLCGYIPDVVLKIIHLVPEIKYSS